MQTNQHTPFIYFSKQLIKTALSPILLCFLLALTFHSGLHAQQKNKTYFPPAGAWDKQTPAKSGFDSTQLQQAIQFAIDNESKRPRDIRLSQQLDYSKEPFSEPIGPLGFRGDPTGIIIHHGYLIASWGNPDQVEITNSVSKSFLSTTVGLAIDKGLIHHVTDTIADYVKTIQLYNPAEHDAPELIYPFSNTQNRKLNWDVMLRQTSDWEGTLWGKPDWADRPDKDSTTWLTRKRNEPGTVFEYNDVRVNALALATTLVWRKPLPEVLKTYIMDPIGASGTWQWYGYNNSWIVLDGKAIQSVSGGGHWGGGMFINAWDMARFGLLTLHKGNWNGKQLISADWIKQSTTATTANTGYGFMNFFLNTNKKYYPAVPENAFIHLGNGTNIIYADPRHDLVVVCRWINSPAINDFLGKVLASLKD